MKLAAIITITAPIGNAATILTDWKLLMELSTNRSAIGSRISTEYLCSAALHPPAGDNCSRKP